MTRDVYFTRAIAVALAIVALSLAGCGRRGPLEAPPEAAARSVGPLPTDDNETALAENGQPGAIQSPTQAGQTINPPPQNKSSKKKDVPLGPPKGQTFFLDPLL